MKQSTRYRDNCRGMGLLEVVLAIVIFAVGMLALMQLQGNIARSSGDASARTVAASLAEEIVETAKAFTEVLAADNGRQDYNEIVSNDWEVLRGGVNYAVSLEVVDYYFDRALQAFVTDPPDGAVLSDFKRLDLTVAWNSDANSELVNLGSGGIRVTEIISSTPSSMGARIAATSDGQQGTPTVTYTPGENPDIVALRLGDDTHRFKESTSPRPDVIRDQNVETWFDVVTYSQNPSSEAQFLRREEFVAVSCDCILDTSANAQGRRPALWDGYEYTVGEMVAKPSGRVPGGAQQSPFCDLCCRDHHDGGSASAGDIYNPAANDGVQNHAHYGRDNRGQINLVPAEHGDRYVEACRLIRKDGFMQLTQDANQQGLLGFPEEYLTFSDNLADYSGYVIGAVDGFYRGGGFSQPEDVGYAIPASTPELPTHLPTVVNSSWQQLRSRAVYTDFLSQAAQDNIANCFDHGVQPPAPTPDNAGCHVPNAASPLEIYPFFDLQMTWLARWNENPITTLADVTNEPIKTGNAHSRGKASIETQDGSAGRSDLLISSHTGNLGLTATGAIDGTYNLRVRKRDLYMEVNGDSTPPEGSGLVVRGRIGSAVARVNAADLVLEPNVYAFCGQTDVDYACLVRNAGATLTVSGYYKRNTPLWVCSDWLTVLESYQGESLAANQTVFALPLYPDPQVSYDFYISSNPCP